MTVEQKGFGKIVLFSFIGFFATIFLVNVVFIYTAIHSNTGVVTEESYEKGLAYDDVLKRAETQPKLMETMSYKAGTLSWTIQNAHGKPIEDAIVHAKLIRPVQDGFDFDVPLQHISGGRYAAAVKFPLEGMWTAKLDAKWDKQQYQTSHPVMVK